MTDLPLDTIVCGDCLQVMKEWPDCCIDAIVTDPPAGIAFMGKEWDDFRRARNVKDTARDNQFGRLSRCGPEIGRRPRDLFIAWMTEIAAECLRVLKPGGHALVWSIARTSHWTATAWEDAGFEIRDKIYHAFGSGFPKSLDVSKAMDKAAGAEREVIGDKSFGVNGRRRNPSVHTPHKNTQHMGEWGFTTSLYSQLLTAPATPAAQQWQGWGTALKPAIEEWHLFRKPLSEPTVAQNVLKWGTGAINVDACRVPMNGEVVSTGQGASDHIYGGGKGLRPAELGTQEFTSHASGRWPSQLTHDGSEEVVGMFPQSRSDGGTRPWVRSSEIFLEPENRVPFNYGDSGSAARFFYCAKSSRSERTCNGTVNNDHPTVKPLALMRYLCRLITPPGGLILDCFAGSGTTCIAARDEGFRFLGIEEDEHNCAIARARLAAVDTGVPVTEARAGQMSLFGNPVTDD